MPTNFFQKSLHLLLRRQTNILSAAFVIMATVIFSQVLGLVRQRLLVAIFGPSNNLGVYLASAKLPDFLFQIIIAGALSSAFIPVFSEYLLNQKEKQGYKFASTLLSLGLAIFLVFAVILMIFAEFFSHLIAPGFSHTETVLMANLMRLVLVGEMLFIIGSFLSAVLQSYNHFFIPGFAAALYNLGIIIGIVFLYPVAGIFAPAWGVVIGALIFVLLQLPFARHVGFTFNLSFNYKESGIAEVFHLMWPRTISLAIFQVGTLLTVTLISFLHDPGRSYVIFDYAQTLAFAPVVLFGQAIAQAAFPILAREREKLDEFRQTFLTSFNQLLYLILPISVLLLVLRIPIVRLLYGAAQFDWPATVLTGRTLAYFAIGIFAQGLIYLVSRGFYALHDAKTPLIVGAVTTLFMIAMGVGFVFGFHGGVISIALAYSLGGILQFLLLFFYLDRRVGGFGKRELFMSVGKIFIATFCTGFALYIPIKLLDQLVFDTTKTINLLILTGISSTLGICLYLFLTWVFNVKEAATFLLLFKRVGNWKDVLAKSKETIEAARIKQ